MRISKKVAFAILIAVLVIPTTYFALLFLDVVSRHGYRKEAVIQVRLTGIRYVIDSLTVERGSFVCSLTFSNPTHEAVNMRVLYVNLWASSLMWHEYLIASGGSKTDHIIDPGTAQISVELELNSDYTGDVLLAQQVLVEVRYSSKLGPTAYTMRATVQNSTVETEGPFYAWGIDETESALLTYLLSTIAVWTIPLEILASVVILRGRKAESAALSHDKMLSVIYSLQGVGFIAAPLWSDIVNSLIPPLPPPDFYYSSFASAFAGFFLFILGFSVSLVFFVIAYGFLRHRNWAKRIALPLSALFLVAWSYSEVHLIMAWFSGGLLDTYHLSLTFVILALAVANAIVVGVLVWRYMIHRRAKSVELKPFRLS